MIRNDFSRLFELLAEAQRIVESDDAAAARRVVIKDVPQLVPSNDAFKFGPTPSVVWDRHVVIKHNKAEAS